MLLEFSLVRLIFLKTSINDLSFSVLMLGSIFSYIVGYWVLYEMYVFIAFDVVNFLTISITSLLIMKRRQFKLF